MFLHEYFVVVSIAAVMNAVDFLWGIVVGLVLACIIMVVNVSRCARTHAAAD
jgi:MFS superfamily sulfate permease-like transporter